MNDINWLDERIADVRKQVALLSLELSRLERERAMVASEAATKKDGRSLLQG